MQERLNKLWGKTKIVGKESWYFFSSLYFLKNLGMLLAASLVLLFGTQIWLSFYTNHGESMEVQDFVGVKAEKAKSMAEARSMKVIVKDSLWRAGKKGGTVANQDPPAGSRVKENRTIVLNTYKYEEMYKLPLLEKSSYRFDIYKKKLQDNDVKLVQEKEEVFDAKQQAGTIVHLLYNGKILTDTELEKGIEIRKEHDAISAVITKRSSDFIAVPNVVCDTYGAAEFTINSVKLNIDIVGNVQSLQESYVYKQEPTSSKSLRIGETVILYLTDGIPDGCN